MRFQERRLNQLAPEIWWCVRPVAAEWCTVVPDSTACSTASRAKRAIAPDGNHKPKDCRAVSLRAGIVGELSIHPSASGRCHQVSAIRVGGGRRRRPRRLFRSDSGSTPRWRGISASERSRYLRAAAGFLPTRAALTPVALKALLLVSQSVRYQQGPVLPGSSIPKQEDKFFVFIQNSHCILYLSCSISWQILFSYMI